MSDNEKLAQAVVGVESEARIFNMGDKALVDNMVKEQAKTEFNQKVGDYIEKLDKHQELLDEYAKQFADTMQGLEIMPLYRYALIKPFDNNPFQQVKREGNIITDTGGLIEFKNTDTGEWEEEESYIQVAMIMEVGPECKYLKVGDVVMYRKESAFPVPFYKQNFMVIDEQRISVVINEGLHDRLNK